MIDNVHGDKNKTPPPFGIQNVMLHAIYSTKTLPEILRRLQFEKLGKNIRRSRVWISHFQLAIYEALWQFSKEFFHFSKNYESLKWDTSWVFRVIHWTSYIVRYFKPTKYHLMNNKVILHRFIVNIYFKLHTSILCNYHFITIY